MVYHRYTHMPYLDSKISDKHKRKCPDPFAIRLYVRDYNKSREQRAFVPWGITCPSCGVVVLDENRPAWYHPGDDAERKRIREHIPKGNIKRIRVLRGGLDSLR